VVEDARGSRKGRGSQAGRAAHLRLPVPGPAAEHAQRPGFIYDHVSNLWLVEVATGAARRLTTGRTNHEDPVFSPDGTRVAYVAQGGRDPDLGWQFDRARGGCRERP